MWFGNAVYDRSANVKIMVRSVLHSQEIKKNFDFIFVS